MLFFFVLLIVNFKRRNFVQKFKNTIVTTGMLLFWKEAAADHIADILFVWNFVLFVEIFILKIYCICPPIDLILFSFLQWALKGPVWSMLLHFWSVYPRADVQLWFICMTCQASTGWNIHLITV